jgi:hypothetical protein
MLMAPSHHRPTRGLTPGDDDAQKFAVIFMLCKALFNIAQIAPQGFFSPAGSKNEYRPAALRRPSRPISSVASWTKSTSVFKKPQALNAVENAL